MNEILNKILNIIDPDLLIWCYAKITNADKLHKQFKNMKFDHSNEQDRIFIYKKYVDIMLPKYMDEKGHEKLPNWQAIISLDINRTTGGFDVMKKEIKISKWVIESEKTTFDDLRELILHEISHVNSWIKHGDLFHGQGWKTEAKLIGHKGKECLPDKYLDVIDDVAMYKCGNADHPCTVFKKLSKKDMLKFTKKSSKTLCKKHGLPYDFKDITTLKNLKA